VESHELSGKNIVVGVCATIAAYKSVDLCRRLVEAGANVAPVLTEDATRFVGEVTFSAVATETAHTSLWSDEDPIPHTRLGQWADAIVVAPASADFIAKYANGFGNDLLSATLLASRAPVVICPSMHTEMWEHQAVQTNIATLRNRGVQVVEPEVGALAGGDIGAGRFPETQMIISAVESVFVAQDLEGLTVLVTAGGTREPLDSVRYISNRSSGKQGHAIAEEASLRGAKTVLVTASHLPASNQVEVVKVNTSAEMAQAVFDRSSTADVVVMAAAVADYRVAEPSLTKIKKSNEELTIALEPTVDILTELSSRRNPKQTIVGFAAEDSSVIENAKAKLKNKRLDLIVANNISEPHAGFDVDTNRVSIISPSGKVNEVHSTKKEVARVLFDSIIYLRKS
jgi:phosphopantothenoylcysteine decarboxylase/phosphopantothenate--cysteine ligase